MRRKNWINKKKTLYGRYLNTNKNINFNFFNFFLKKKEFIFDKYNTRGQLYKVDLKKTKNSNLNFELNYYFYSDLLKNLKYINKKIIFNNFLKNNNNILFLLPSYTFKNQFFSHKSLFGDLLLMFKLRGFFIYKNYFNIIGYKNNNFFYKKHLIGYNFYIFNKMYKRYNDFFKITDDKEYNPVGKVKFLLTKQIIFDFKLNSEFNVFFNFNIYLLNIIEIYKIIVLLHLLGCTQFPNQANN